MSASGLKVITASGARRETQVVPSAWDCVFDCNGYLINMGYVDDDDGTTLVSCFCSEAGTRGFGNCSARYLIAKYVTTCNFCKTTIKPVRTIE